MDMALLVGSVNGAALSGKTLQGILCRVSIAVGTDTDTGDLRVQRIKKRFRGGVFRAMVSRTNTSPGRMR